MLDEKDLQAIAELMDAKIKASAQDLEERLTAKIESSAEDTRSQLMAYIEAVVTPKFNLLADVCALHEQTMARVEQVKDLEDEIDFLKKISEVHTKDILALKKAQ